MRCAKYLRENRVSYVFVVVFLLFLAEPVILLVLADQKRAGISKMAFFLSDNDRCDFVCIKIVFAEHDYLHGTLYCAVIKAQKRAPLMTLGSQ